MLAFLTGAKGKPIGEKQSTSKKSNKQAHVPWVEKYRPRTVSDVVEQTEVVAVLEKCIAGADLPNFLLYGPPGTGKTSTILAAARQLFGDMYKDRLLEINASDDRGIQIIREKVQQFSERAVSGVRPDGKPCPALKIVILDEADSMTNAAQAALRKIMESNAKTTRFCLICNYVSRIIDPITSRCAKFRFKPLQDQMVQERLNLICENEEVACDEATLKALVETSGGDMRRAITCLQSCAKLRGKNIPIEINDVLEVTGVIPDEFLKEFLTVCESKDDIMLQKFMLKVKCNAYSILQMVAQLNEVIVNSNDYSEQSKTIIGDKIGLVMYRLQEGCSEYLAILELALTIMCNS